MEYLYDKLLKYSSSDYYGFHMPGHKRNKNLMDCELPYILDITEIDGFDDLHHAKGILKYAQERAASVYHAGHTYFLINGSTSGILSAVMGCTSKGDKILCARNCHKSVYHAIYMNELKPVYVYPEYYGDIELNGTIQVSDIRKALEEHGDIRAVVITSPTYDGVVSDVRLIAEEVHEKGIPLIVDEAHGAHFGMHPYFPGNSNVQGADVVIHSLHKTLPSLTQTALIHLNGNLVNQREIERYLHMLQTSSPSYVLMAGIDECVRMLDDKGSICFQPYVDLLKKVRDRLGRLQNLKLIETDCFDRSKIVISVKGTSISSRELYDTLLNRYHLQMEMTAGSYVLAMTSMGDTAEGMERLIVALKEIDAEITSIKRKAAEEMPGDQSEAQLHFLLPRLKQVYTSAEMGQILKNGQSGVSESYLQENAALTEYMSWDECEGFVSAEYAYIYPPGIPLIVPGEEISSEAVSLLCEYKKMGFSIEGPENEGKVEVLVNG